MTDERDTEDDTEWLQALLDAGKPIPPGVYHLAGPLKFPMERAPGSLPAEGET